MTPTTAACGFYRPGTTRTDELSTIRAEVTDALTATLIDTPIHQRWRLCWTPTFNGIELVVAIPASLATADSLTLFADTITHTASGPSPQLSATTSSPEQSNNSAPRNTR